MAIKEFMHRYNYACSDGIECGGESLTETDGYRSTEQMVKEFVAAGLTLQAARLAQGYEYPDGDVPDDAAPDPTRSGAFDLSDASRLSRDADARLRKQAADAKAAKEAANALEAENIAKAKRSEAEA